MAGTGEKRSMILEHEERFADALAVQVLDKPQLSIWMILIPLIFLYFFYRYHKFNAGRRMFAHHYMISRRRALDEAFAVVETGREPDIQELAKESTLPEQVRDRHAEMLGVLVEHYVDLLRSEGEDYESLVTSAYGKRANYLLFINRLNQVEKVLNAALKPHLQRTTEGVNGVVSTMESCSERLRREIAERIFG